MEITELGLSQPLLKAVVEMGFQQPTPIQQQAIPFLLHSRGDLIALAATGTGKTAAFGLPLLQRLEPADKKIQALVLCPTRELCRQITAEFRNFSKFLPQFEVVALYGGAPIGKQIQQLRQQPQVVIATPGRMKDLQARGVADLSSINLLVLDEADEMLNMGFEEDLTVILSQTPTKKQIALFSATLSPRIAKIATRYLCNPKEISVGVKNQAGNSIEHFYYLVYHAQRYQALRRILDFNVDFYGIVFCRTRQATADVASWLVRDGYQAEALHGEVAQAQRDTVMRRFRKGEIKILIATDVAARGIDVGDLTHVVHYELPEDSEAYIHRSGRTGRVNKRGISLAIVSPSEKRRLLFLERLVKKPIERCELPTVPEMVEKRLSLLQEELLWFSPKREEKRELVTNLSEIPKVLSRYQELFNRFDKETLIDFLLHVHLDALLSYYESAEPLRVVASSLKEKSGGQRRKEEVEGLQKEGLRKGTAARKISSKRMVSTGKYQRFFISLGKKDGLQPKDIIGFINQSTGDRFISIGQIEMKPSFSFVEIESSYCDLVLKKSNGYSFKKRIVTVELAEEENFPKSKGNKRGKSKKGTQRL